MAKKTSPALPPVSIEDRILLAIVAGAEPSAIAVELKLDLGKFTAGMAAAHHRLAIAAERMQDGKLAASMTRLNDCYKKSMQVKDFKACVQVQKELNKLMDLYRPKGRQSETASRAEIELDAVRGHLAPLKLAPDGTACEELARLTVAELVRVKHGAAG